MSKYDNIEVKDGVRKIEFMLKDLYEYSPFLNKLYNTPITQKEGSVFVGIVFRCISDLVAKINTATQRFELTKKGLLFEFAEKKDGQIVYTKNEHTGEQEPMMQDENRRKFDTEIHKLLTDTVTIEFEPINSVMLRALELDTFTYDMLKPFILNLEHMTYEDYIKEMKEICSEISNTSN